MTCLILATARLVIGPKPLEFCRQLNALKVDSAIRELRTGDVALRMGLGADSYMFAQMNRRNKSYSHCGIVVVEHGYPFVYHSIGGEDNPDARLRRDSASRFFSPVANSSIAVARYDMCADQFTALRAVVATYYARKPRFDMKFDLSTDDFLYCAEFVYKALNKAAGDSAFITPSRYLGYRFVGVDDVYMNRHGSIVWQTAFK